MIRADILYSLCPFGMDPTYLCNFGVFHADRNYSNSIASWPPDPTRRVSHRNGMIPHGPRYLV